MSKTVVFIDLSDVKRKIAVNASQVSSRYLDIDKEIFSILTYLSEMDIHKEQISTYQKIRDLSLASCEIAELEISSMPHFMVQTSREFLEMGREHLGVLAEAVYEIKKHKELNPSVSEEIIRAESSFRVDIFKKLALIDSLYKMRDGLLNDAAIAAYKLAA